MNALEVGDKIPDFAIKDYEGIELESDDLTGNPFVLYFYPKDETPGCTKEACSFRDSMERFEGMGTTVIGVSPDSASSHANFIGKHNLNFTLLCDEDMALATLFGAIQEKNEGDKSKPSIVRSTFLINSEGVIQWLERPVSVEGHAERVLNAIEELTNDSRRR